MSPLFVHSLVERRREELEVQEETLPEPGPAVPRRLGYRANQGPWSPGWPQPPQSEDGW